MSGYHSLRGIKGTFYEGVMTVGYPSDETIAAVPAWMLARRPELATGPQSLVRMPNGLDLDSVCEDFQLSSLPAPGAPNRVE